MAFSSSRAVSVVYKAQSAIGTAESGTGGTGFRANSGGLNLSITPIESGESRRDGMSTRGRHGSRNVSGSYTADLSLGSFDDLVASVFWGAFDTAISIDDETVAMSSATVSVSSNVITASGGSFITAGLRVGDVIRSTEGLNAADLNKNIIVTALTATAITCVRADGVAMTDVAGPVSAWTITRARKVMQGTTKSAFTIEETETDIDGSEIFEWCRPSSFTISMQPNGMGIVTFNFVGRNMATATGESSPSLTSPTYTTSIGLTAVEAKILLGGTAVTDLTGVELTFDRRAAGNPVVGSNLTPDVFANTATLTGTITALRQDLTRTAAALAESESSLILLFQENESAPQDYICIHVPYMTLTPDSKSELGTDGPRSQTLGIMAGADGRGGAYDAKMMSWQTTTVAA